MSPLTASVNEEALKSLLDLELRNRRAEQAEANFGTIDEPSLCEDREDDSPRSPVNRKKPAPDIGKSLKQQREHIRDMMLLTNKVFPEYKTDQYDFQILDSKSIGRVEIKAQPYTQYLGKVRVKGNEAPLRFELLNERLSLHIDVCFDDATFSKNTVHSIHSQEDKLMLHFNKNTEWAYIRVVYESQDLAGILLVFRAYFGKQQQLLQSSGGGNMPTPPPVTSL